MALPSCVRRFLVNVRGVAAVETALLTPVALAVLGLAVYGGEGFSIQRKVTLATRTVTDLVAQSPLGTSSATINQSALDYYLALASVIVYPYDPTALTVVMSEVKVTNGSTSGTVVWSEPYNGGTARAVGSTVSVPSAVAGAGATYLLYAELSYNYTPIALISAISPLTLSDSIFMSPRMATQITVNWGS